MIQNGFSLDEDILKAPDWLVIMLLIAAIILAIVIVVIALVSLSVVIRSNFLWLYVTVIFASVICGENG